MWFAQMILTLALYLLGAVIIGISAFPGIMLFMVFWSKIAGASLWLKALVLSLSIGFGYFLYGITLILIAGLLRFLLRLELKEGIYKPGSWGMLKWMVYNALILLVSNTFMNFMLLTPLMNLFYRLMGAKLGRGVQINSSYCADLCLLEIGDDSVIGGHATVIAHSFERGRLILKKVKIGKGVVIGLNSVVFPGVEIENGAIIPAGSIVPKGTKVKERSVWKEHA